MGDGLKFDKGKDGGDRTIPDLSNLSPEILFGKRTDYESAGPSGNSTNPGIADSRQPQRANESHARLGNLSDGSPYDDVTRIRITAWPEAPSGSAPGQSPFRGLGNFWQPPRPRGEVAPVEPPLITGPNRLPGGKELPSPLPPSIKDSPLPRREAPVAPPSGERPSSGTAPDDLARLNAQIAEHEAHDKKQSYLRKFAGIFYGKADDSLDKLRELSQRRKQETALDPQKFRQEVEDQIKLDRTALGTRDEIGTYGTGFLKTAGLFLRGKLGLATTVGFYALDQMKPADRFWNQVEDAGWGTVKGVALRGALTSLGRTEAGIAAKGVAMGVSSRVLELGLNRETYVDAKTGERNWLSGLRNVGVAALSKESLAVDVITFAVAHGAFGTANRLTAGSLAKSPFLSNVLTGGTFGLSAGATGEIMRQKNAGESLDFGKILKRGAVQGAVDALAAAPGGFQADAGMRAGLRVKLEKGLDRIRPEMSIEFDRTTDRLLNELSSEAFDRVHINPPRAESLKELGKRLISHTTRNKVYEIPKEEVKGPFKDYADFSSRALENGYRDYRDYSVDGHKARILVPEDFARQLDQVRQLRLEAERDPSKLSESEAKRVRQAREELSGHPLKDRLLPEELLPLMDELPDRALVKNVYLNNEADPHNAWHSQKYKEENFQAAASASASGDINFYRQNRGNVVREHLFHEWAHLHKYVAGKKSDLFDKAAMLERDGHFARDYGRKSDHENWAVNMGEELLHLDGDRFFIMARRAPLRAAVWGKAMQERLDAISPENRSPYHAQFVERLKYLESAVTPNAVRILIDNLKSGDAKARDASLDLISLLGDASCVSQLKSTAKYAGDTSLSSRAFALAERLLIGDKVDFYLEMAQPGSAVAKDAKQRLARLPDSRAQQAYANLAKQ